MYLCVELEGDWEGKKEEVGSSLTNFGKWEMELIFKEGIHFSMECEESPRPQKSWRRGGKACPGTEGKVREQYGRRKGQKTKVMHGERRKGARF